MFQVTLQAMPGNTPGAPVIGINGLLTLRGTFVSATRALISEHDDWATATGSLDLQTSAAAPDGTYAFAIQGSDTNNGNALVAGGIMHFDGGSLVVTDSVLDINDGGSALTGQTFTSGTVSTADAYGRVTIALVPTTSASMTFSAYSVSSSRIYLIEDQADVANANLGGTGLGQGANAGKFTMTTVAGASYAFGVAGLDNAAPSGSSVTIAGGFGLNADGSVSGAAAFADYNVHQGDQLSGSWTVAPNGRVTINPVSFPTTGVTLSFQLYLDGDGNGLVIGMDSFQITEGPAFAQTSNATALSGLARHDCSRTQRELGNLQRGGPGKRDHGRFVGHGRSQQQRLALFGDRRQRLAERRQRHAEPYRSQPERSIRQHRLGLLSHRQRTYAGHRSRRQSARVAVARGKWPDSLTGCNECHELPRRTNHGSGAFQTLDVPRMRLPL